MDTVTAPPADEPDTERMLAFQGRLARFYDEAVALAHEHAVVDETDNGYHRGWMDPATGVLASVVEELQRSLTADDRPISATDYRVWRDDVAHLGDSHPSNEERARREVDDLRTVVGMLAAGALAAVGEDLLELRQQAAELERIRMAVGIASDTLRAAIGEAS